MSKKKLERLFYWLLSLPPHSFNSQQGSMSTKYSAPRRRKTLPYPSPPSSIDSVSSCSSFSSQESLSTPSSSPTEPTFTKHFSHEPEIKNALDYSIPPPTAQFFHSERVSKPPKKFTKKEEWKLWYSANFGTNLLEPVSIPLDLFVMRWKVADSSSTFSRVVGKHFTSSVSLALSPARFDRIWADTRRYWTDLLCLSILVLTYIALSRFLKLSTLARIGSRIQFYATGAVGGIVEKSTLL